MLLAKRPRAAASAFCGGGGFYGTGTANPIENKSEGCIDYMFQIAIERLAREVAAVEKTDYFQSTEKIEQILNKK